MTVEFFFILFAGKRERGGGSSTGWSRLGKVSLGVCFRHKRKRDVQNIVVVLISDVIASLSLPF
jgi:hypothetical protein